MITSCTSFKICVLLVNSFTANISIRRPSRVAQKRSCFTYTCTFEYGE